MSQTQDSQTKDTVKPTCAPTTTSNQLCDIIDWISAGYVVALHVDGKHASIYHKCDNTCTIDNTAFIMIDCNKMPSLLLDEGEWPSYIETKHSKCSCNFGKKITYDNHDIKFIYAFSI